MAGRIPQSFIDDLLARLDIVEVIDARVPLQKKGKEYMACCPFHNEKTPSFTVSQGKQFYHCFGCKAHGTAISFIMDYEHLSFPEAIEELAHSIGLEVPYEKGEKPSPEKKQQQENLYELMQSCDRFYRQQLRQHPQAEKAVNYLKNRGLSGEIAAEYGIGYAPAGWDNLLRQLGQTPQAQQALVSCGMLIRKDDGKCYDRFRERIMFPIRDRRGRTIAFGGRIINPEDEPKYLNSPETPLFHKGRELYGLYEARQALREIPRLMVVEGYMDVVALAQFGIRYAVATLGTATTADHLQRLFQLTDEVVFCFDGDQAGNEAAWRALQVALPTIQEGKEIRFMFLPQGEDPDSQVRKVGKELFEQQLQQAITFAEFLFQKLQQDTDMSRIGGRAKLVESARPLLNQIPKGIYRHMLIEQLATLARIDIQEIERALNGNQAISLPRENLTRETRFSGGRNTTSRAASAKAPLTPVRKALCLLLHQPRLASHWHDLAALQALDLPGMDLLLEVLEILKNNPNLSTSALLERWRGTEAGSHLTKLAAWQPEIDDDAALAVEFGATLQALADQGLELRYDQLLAKSNQGNLSNEELQEFRSLLEKVKDAKHKVAPTK